MVGPGLKTVVGLSLLVLLSACGDKKPVEKDRPRVFVQEVKPADYAATVTLTGDCLLYTSPSPRDRQKSRMPSSA